MKTDVNPARVIEYEKARFEYCEKLYEREMARKETLEKKAQFILSFITLFLGVIFFRLDFFTTLSTLITKQRIPTSLVWTLYISLSVLALSLLLSLLSVMQAIRLQKFKEEHPKYFISSLFAPNSEYLKHHDEASLFKATAMSYAIALEHNSSINDQKARWVRYSWLGIIPAALSLALFLLVFAIISIR